jgi:hypothetical protein
VNACLVCPSSGLAGPLHCCPSKGQLPPMASSGPLVAPTRARIMPPQGLVFVCAPPVQGLTAASSGPWNLRLECPPMFTGCPPRNDCLSAGPPVGARTVAGTEPPIPWHASSASTESGAFRGVPMASSGLSRASTGQPPVAPWRPLLPLQRPSAGQQLPVASSGPKHSWGSSLQWPPVASSGLQWLPLQVPSTAQQPPVASCGPQLPLSSSTAAAARAANLCAASATGWGLHVVVHLWQLCSSLRHSRCDSGCARCEPPPGGAPGVACSKRSCCGWSMARPFALVSAVLDSCAGGAGNAICILGWIRSKKAHMTPPISLGAMC